MARPAKKIARQNSGLLGPFALTGDSIAEYIETLSIGTFAVGRLRAGENGVRFFVRKVGRDDRDLGAALRSLIGSKDQAYDAFKFRTYVSTRRAFEKECQLFHAFAPPDSPIHPVRPPGTRFVCPVADCPDSGEPWGGAGGAPEQ